MELLVEDADIITMAARAEPARSLLVRDGRIAAVGPAGQVRAAAGPDAQRVRLAGATVLPGLIDAHCHVSDVGYLAAGADCRQPSAPDIPAIQARLRDAAGRTPPGAWVTGSGYLEYQLREGRHPTRADLDRAVPDRPAVLYHTSLHACVLNSAALAEAGFADGQPDPPGGAFGRDDAGRLDGVLYEGPMFALFEHNFRADLARMSAAQRAGLMQLAGQHFTALGVTAACDADVRRDTLTAFAEADEHSVLPMRIYGLVVHDQLDWLLESGLRGRHSDRLTADAVKIWADGGMSSRTAAIHGSYPVPPYGSGILSFSRGELTGMVGDFAARGFQVCIHAQGDRAIEAVLDAYTAVLAQRAGGAGGPAGRAVRATRGGTGSSTPGRCTRRWPPGPRRSASWWPASPASCPRWVTVSPPPSQSPVTSCTRSPRGGGPASRWPGHPTHRSSRPARWSASAMPCSAGPRPGCSAPVSG